MNLFIINAFLSLLFFACHSPLTTKNEQHKKYVDMPLPGALDFDAHVNYDSIIQYSRISNKVKELNKYLTGKDEFSKDIFFLVDMRIQSNYKRFFVYDNKTKKVIYEGMVAHGSGSMTDDDDSLYFSNVPNSLCTSLGKYKISEKYSGQFGTSYKLYGLDQSNSKAYERAIVLHAHKGIPDAESFYPITLSYGCPMVSKTFFSQLEKIIDRSQKNILLSIYY